MLQIKYCQEQIKLRIAFSKCANFQNHIYNERYNDIISQYFFLKNDKIIKVHKKLTPEDNHRQWIIIYSIWQSWLI